METIDLLSPEDLGLTAPDSHKVIDGAIVRLRIGEKPGRNALVLVRDAADGSYFEAYALDDEIVESGTSVTVAYDCVFEVTEIKNANTAYAKTMIRAGWKDGWPAAVQSLLTAVLFVALARGHGAGLMVVAIVVAAAPTARALLRR